MEDSEDLKRKNTLTDNFPSQLCNLEPILALHNDKHLRAWGLSSLYSLRADNTLYGLHVL